MIKNDSYINKLKPKDKIYKVFDTNGLYLEVLVSGKKVWRIKHTKDGRDIRTTLGHYPTLNLEVARRKTLYFKEQLTKGSMFNSPNITFRDVAIQQTNKLKLKWSVTHYETVIYRLNKYVFPCIGNRPISNIQVHDITSMLDKIDKQGKYETCNRILGICSRVFKYAIAKSYCINNPCMNLKETLTVIPSKPMSAIIDPKEVGYLMTNIHNYRGTQIVKYALLWSAYTFCRPIEIRRAEWSEINLNTLTWVIPPEKMKGRIEHRVSLSRQCIQIINKLREMNLSSKWLFPSTRPNRPLSECGVLSALRRMEYSKEEMTAHGFRSMASTLLHELGYKSEIIEKQLAHTDKNKIRAIYNRAEYWNERVIMMQEYADYLDSLSSTLST